MNINYYSILQISPDADIETIRRAYRKLALKYHPDRGGTHEKMVQLNEAWEILSNPITRANYDASRLHAENTEYVRKAETESKEARFKAEQYPRDWKEFETWMDKMLNAVVNDFKKAEYGEMWDGKMPTAGQSFTGWIFIIAGAVLGFFVLVLVLSGINYRVRFYPLYFLFIFGGAWLGKVCHEMIKDQMSSQKPFSHAKPAEKVFTNTNEQTSSDQNNQKSGWEQIPLGGRALIIFIVACFIIILFLLLKEGLQQKKYDNNQQVVAQSAISPKPQHNLVIPAPVPSPAVSADPLPPKTVSIPTPIPNVSNTPDIKIKYNGYSYSASDHSKSAIINNNIYHEGDLLGDHDEYILKSINPSYVVIENKDNKSAVVVKFNQ